MLPAVSLLATGAMSAKIVARPLLLRILPRAYMTADRKTHPNLLYESIPDND